MSAATISAAETAIARIHQAAADYAAARTVEIMLEDERPRVKVAAILRLMEQANPTGQNGKLHSASSAEAVVETDADYLAYRERQRAAVVATIGARAALDAAKLTAELAALLVRADA